MDLCMKQILNSHLYGGDYNRLSFLKMNSIVHILSNDKYIVDFCFDFAFWVILVHNQGPLYTTLK